MWISNIIYSGYMKICPQAKSAVQSDSKYYLRTSLKRLRLERVQYFIPRLYLLRLIFMLLVSPENISFYQKHDLMYSACWIKHISKGIPRLALMYVSYTIFLACIPSNVLDSIYSPQLQLTVCFFPRYAMSMGSFWYMRMSKFPHASGRSHLTCY